MRDDIVKENHISSAVSKIFWYKHTDRLTDIMLLLSKNLYPKSYGTIFILTYLIIFIILEKVGFILEYNYKTHAQHFRERRSKL